MSRRQPDSTWVFPLDLPDSARPELERVQRILDGNRMNKAAALSMVCPKGHALGWVFDGPIGPVAVFRADDKAHSSGVHMVLEFIDFLDLTAATEPASAFWLKWGVACVCGHREVCRPWLVSHLQAGHRREVVPKDHLEVGPLPDMSPGPKPGGPPTSEEIAAHQRCSFVIV
jgi:hypothetical protein